MKTDQKAALSPQLALHLAQFGQLAARLRIARRLTQSVAAERARISRNTLSRIENGDPSVAVGQILRYLHTLGREDLLMRIVDVSDSALGQLEMREKTRRARPLTARELSKYDF